MPQLESHLGDDFALIPVGSMVETGLKVLHQLSERGLKGKLINPRKLCPMPSEEILALVGNCKTIVTIEDHVAKGGFGQLLQIALADTNSMKEIIKVSLPDTFIEHGQVSELHKQFGLDADSIENRIFSALYPR